VERGEDVMLAGRLPSIPESCLRDSVPPEAQAVGPCVCHKDAGGEEAAWTSD
jgi:hypothetical protein